MFTRHVLRFLNAKKRTAHEKVISVKEMNSIGKATVDAAGIARAATGLGLAYGASVGVFGAVEALRVDKPELARGIFCVSTGLGGATISKRRYF